MTIATFAGIRAALKTRLSELLTTANPAGPIAEVISHAGRAERADIEVNGNTPAVVIAFDREIFQQKDSTVRTLRSVSQTASELRWAIFVVVVAEEKPEVVADDTATNSLDVCVDAVLNKLRGYKIPGLVSRGEVELIDMAPEKPLNGVFITRINVRTPRALVVPAADTSSLSPVLLDGDVNLEGRTPDAPNPRVQFEADPPDT